MDWPLLSQDYNRVTYSTGDLLGIEARTNAMTVITAGTAWPTNNQAIYIPFIVSQPFAALLMMIANAGTVSGNVDVGIYDNQQNRLVSMGSTAQAGTSAIQSFDITDTTLLPGVYYMAAAMDNTTGLMLNLTAGAIGMTRAFGILSQSTAFALPATATFAAAQSTMIPFVAVTGRTLI